MVKLEGNNVPELAGSGKHPTEAEIDEALDESFPASDSEEHETTRLFDGEMLQQHGVKYAE